MAVDVKICGVLRPEDAAFAAASGAWRLGVIFAGGPRQASLAQAAEVVSAANGVPVMGVFGGQTGSEMLDIVAATGIAGAQLQQSTGPDTVLALRRAGVEVWQVVPIGPDTTAAELELQPGMAEALVVEARRAGGAGGKGIPIALPDAARARRLMVRGRFVLAGGLTPESVKSAIEVVRPDAVDVSSGTEISPGVKSHDRIARFLENVRAAAN